jgi:hypothetical protein
MNDPHVERLWYRVGSSQFGFTWSDQPPKTAINTECRVTIEDGRAAVEPLRHFVTEERARAAVEPFLRTWEIDAAINHRQPIEPMLFEYERADVVDRSPDPPHLHRLSGVCRVSCVTSSAPVTFALREYPPPPDRFVASHDVQAMWTRWRAYREGRESLPSVAYFCLTLVELSMMRRASAAGREIGLRQARREAASEYSIDHSVLNLLGDLSSDIGDLVTGRKAHVKHPRSHTVQERDWLIAAVKMLMRRLGQWAHDPTQLGRPVTLADLPHV